MAIIWDAKQAKRMKAIAALADFVNVSAASAEAREAAEAVISMYALRAQGDLGQMAHAAAAGTVLSQVLGAAFDDKHVGTLEASTPALLMARMPNVTTNVAADPDAVRYLCACLDTLAESAAASPDDLALVVEDLRMELAPTLAGANKESAGELLSQLLTAQGAAYLGLDEASTRTRHFWRQAAEAQPCLPLATALFGWNSQ